MRLVIQPANASHVEELSRLAKVTFAQSYIGLGGYTEEVIKDYTEQTFALPIIHAELADPKSQYLIASVDGISIGYAKVEERDMPDCLKERAGLYLARLYFEKGFHGQGFGKKMLDAIYTEARSHHHTMVWLSVWELNVKAEAFYQREGFKRVGWWNWKFETRGQKFCDVDYLMTKELNPR